MHFWFPTSTFSVRASLAIGESVDYLFSLKHKLYEKLREAVRGELVWRTRRENLPFVVCFLVETEMMEEIMAEDTTTICCCSSQENPHSTPNVYVVGTRRHYAGFDRFCRRTPSYRCTNFFRRQPYISINRTAGASRVVRRRNRNFNGGRRSPRILLFIICWLGLSPITGAVENTLDMLRDEPGVSVLCHEAKILHRNGLLLWCRFLNRVSCLLFLCCFLISARLHHQS